MSYDRSAILNGARCKSYEWAQSYNDLEIRIKLAKTVKIDDIIVDATKSDISVEILQQAAANKILTSEVVMDGEFEHAIDSESLSWIIEPVEGESQLVIYADKMENLWWKKLLVSEEYVELGPRSFTVPKDSLDRGAHMAIDRLISEQTKRQNAARSAAPGPNDSGC